MPQSNFGLIEEEIIFKLTFFSLRYYEIQSICHVAYFKLSMDEQSFI